MAAVLTVSTSCCPFLLMGRDPDHNGYIGLHHRLPPGRYRSTGKPTMLPHSVHEPS